MQDKVEYVYHWDRIIGAAAILLALIGLAAWGLLRWTSESPERVQVTTSADVEFADSASASPAEPSSPQALEQEPSSESAAIEPPELDRRSNQRAASKNEADQPRASSERAAIAAAPARMNGTTESAMTTAAAIASHDKRTARPPIPVIATQSPAVAMVEAEPPPPAVIGGKTPAQTEPVILKHGPLTVQDIAKHSPLVQRFVLAQSVVDREPMGSIEGNLFNELGVTTIYCFSEITGREHPTLEYVWYRDDKLVARVRVRVNSERWRSYSSKVLNRRMQGNWRVELRGKDDALLAVANFVLSQGPQKN